MLRAYLKLHRKGIAVALLFGVIAAVIFVLYQLPVSAVAYVAALWAFFGAIALGLDYGNFCLKHRELKRRLDILGAALEAGGNAGEGEGTKGGEGTGTDTGETQNARRSVSGNGSQRDRLMFDPDVALEHLPTPSGLPEEDYQALLRMLCRERRELCEEMERRYREMIDYYTVWAHQIKTPIAAMRLMLQETDMRALREELRRIEQYVEMVLCYLRLDSNSTDYVIREYDLDGIVRQAVRRHATTFIQKKLRLEYEPLDARVVTDEKWLLFVIEQILSNALKYTSEGGVAVTLEPPKTLCIRDTGIGIAPEDLPRVFEKGYTGDNGRSDKKASGIGMYLCSRICANLGHGIRVDSTPGQGTEVRIDLKNAELEIE